MLLTIILSVIAGLLVGTRAGVWLERRRNVLQKIRSAVSEVKEIEHGFIYRFPSGAWISELAKGVRSLITSLA